MLATGFGLPYPPIAVPTEYTVSSILMNGEGVMSPVGFDVRVCDPGLSLNVVVGRLISPPGAVIVRAMVEVLV